MADLLVLGRFLHENARLSEADIELSRAAELAEEMKFGGPFYSLALLRIDQKRYQEAEKLLSRCLEIRRKKLEPSDAAITEAIQKLAKVYQLMGRDTEAEKVLENLPVNNPGTP